MTVTSDLLRQAKQRQGIPSNYRLARVLGVTDQTLTNWNTGKKAPADNYAVRLAEMAGIEPGIVLAELAAERAQDDEVRQAWRGLAERLKAAGLAAFVAAFVGVGGPPDASARSLDPAGGADSLCVMSNRRRRGRRAVDSFAERMFSLFQGHGGAFIATA